MTFVVDTNVAIVANGRGIHADEECQSTCVKKLKFLKREVVAIDDKYLILGEYRKHLNSSREPGLGDKFFIDVFNNLHKCERVRMVTVTPSEDDGRGFEELTENTFDRSDRKFLAVAVKAKAVILNATDSDWDEHKALMNALGVKVEQLCSRHARRGR